MWYTISGYDLSKKAAFRSLIKSWTKNFSGKTSIFPYKINIFSETLVSH